MKIIRIKSGFSLMEMMIVLLIISIIAAATAPMITKKMTRGAGTGDSPWVFTGDRNSIGYISNNGQVLIGASKVPDDAKQSKLYIAGANDWSHIRFGNSNNSSSLGITANPGTSTDDSAIGISNVNISNGSIMFGMGQTVGPSTIKSVAIGNSVNVNGECPTAVGFDADATMLDSTAIGREARATGEYSTAAGVRTIASAKCATAYGDTALAEAEYAIAMGRGAIASNLDSLAVGRDVLATGDFATAVGVRAEATALGAVALGDTAKAKAESGLSLGRWSETNGESIAIGYHALTEDYERKILGFTRKTSDKNNIAIGCNAIARGRNNIVIGNNIEFNGTDNVVLGDKNCDVRIRGNLIVDGNVILGRNVDSYVVIRRHTVISPLLRKVSPTGSMKVLAGDDYSLDAYNIDRLMDSDAASKLETLSSDRRLKNVGEKYTAGLEELKKLDFFHYTFKKDEEKTPHVGVMAQDLQKVFPDAVTIGEDGYLRIRLEDMFYAVINAVKELDLKITSIVEKVDNLVKDVTEIKSTIENQQKIIEEQQKTIEAQDKAIKELQKKVNKKSKNSNEK